MKQGSIRTYITEKIDHLRQFIYKFSFVFILCLSVATYLLLATYASNLYLIFKDQLVTISIPLAGFLFAGQSILLSFDAKNKFMDKLKSTEYIKDIHSFCKRSEMSLILSSIISLICSRNQILQIVCTGLFIFGIYFCMWAIVLINRIAYYYSKNS